MLTYDDIGTQLTGVFPTFTINAISAGLPYCIAGDFARFLLDAYKSGSMETLVRAGLFIEDLYACRDEKIVELATIGFLEGIQNVWGNNGVDPEEMVPYLGNESKKWWIRLNRYWNGDMNALAEDTP